MFIDQETQKRVNIHAPYKGRSRLDTPAIRAEVGVIEIPDPDRGNDATQYTQEIDEPPYVVITDKPAWMVAAAAQQKKNTESQAYLDSTDWYVVRFAETGVAIPADITTARAAARASVAPVPTDSDAPAP